MKTSVTLFRLVLYAGLIVVVFASLSERDVSVLAGVFNGSDSTSDPMDPDQQANWVTYPIGYDGSGGALEITVGIKPDSPNAAAMDIPVKNVVRTWNRLQGADRTIFNANVPENELDFESTLLHEMGHALGLGHINFGGPDLNTTSTTRSIPGPSQGDSFDFNSGVDGVPGTPDDQRNDDVNLHWFRKQLNNPFVPSGAVVDSSTYSRDLTDLPSVTDAFFDNVTGNNITTDFRNTQAISAGDLDGDGDFDVIAGDQVTSPVRLYLNNGTSDPFTGVTGIDIDASSTDVVTSVVVGDVNLDGHLDLIVGKDADPNLLYLNNGTSDPFNGVTAITIAAESNATQALVLGDVDEDGDVDLIEGIFGARNKLFLNTGGAFGSGMLIGDGSENLNTTSLSLADADLDPNRTLDLAVGNFGQRNQLHLNTAGTFSTGTDIGTETDNTQSIVLHDLTDDVRRDVVVGNTGINRLYLNNGTSDPFNGVTAQNISNDTDNTAAVTMIEANLDNAPDVVAANSADTENKLYKHNGTATPFNGVTAENITSDVFSTRAIVSVDIDGNSYADILVGNFGQRNRYYLNNGPFHNYAANAHRFVGAAYGFPSSEAIMSTAQTTKQATRDLGHDDVATIRFAMSGLDRSQGTADDFTYSLKFLGLTDQANIVIDFDSTQVEPVAVASTLASVFTSPAEERIQITSAEIFFREETTWFFNPQLEAAVVFADFQHDGQEDGTETFPFNTVAEALADVAIGGTIEFAAGDSSETPTIDQAVTLTAAGPSARIGIMAAKSAQAHDHPATRGAQPKTKAQRTGFVSTPHDQGNKQ